MRARVHGTCNVFFGHADSRKRLCFAKDHVLVYDSPPQLAEDTLKMLESMGLSRYFYDINGEGEPMFETLSRQYTNAREKLKEYYTEQTALLAYDILKWDYQVLGLEFPFPEWL